MNSSHSFPSVAASDLSAEAQFYRRVQQITSRIHGTGHLDQLMLESAADICELLQADRLTLYAVSADGQHIVSRIKTGLNLTRDIRLPVNLQSLAGFVAVKRRALAIRDVYDAAELAAIDPRLTFQKEVDRRTGFRTRQMMVAPIADGTLVLGVLQVINHRQGGAFGPLALDAVAELCKTLAVAMQRLQQAEQGGSLQRTSKYGALLAQGVLTPAELQAAMQAARERGQPLETVLLADLKLQPAQLGNALSRFFGVPYAAHQPGRVRNEALHGRVKKDYVQGHHWLALESTPDGLLVMCLDPEEVQHDRWVPQLYPQFKQFVYAVTTQVDFEQTVAQLYGGAPVAASIGDMLADLHAAADTDAADDGEHEAQASAAAADNELVKFVNKLILDAHQQGASDIHIEPLPGHQNTGVRFRIDGSLVPYVEVPASYRQALVTRIKIMCDLDISEKRKPQDGKIKFKRFGPLDIELRVATLPSAGGVEDVVLRILAAGEPIPMAQLGLSAHNQAQLERTVAQPYGLFYVCGPTGSGKTTTLHSILKHLNTPDTKIWTAEDPVEITQKGLRQVQVNRKAGIDFALVMRAFLRADPDIIMVGESRDQETVRMGIEASLTGHLVFSTLHTNSAPESITRLLDMGMDPFNFADALLGILAQRLAKRLCACKQAYEPDDAELDTFVREYATDLQATRTWSSDPQGERDALLADWRARYGVVSGFQSGTPPGADKRLVFYRAVGCETCRGSGYKGRVGLHELLVADDTVRHLIQQRARVAEVFAAGVEGGMRSLKMDGMEKVLAGLTDLPQVRKVCIK